MDDKRTDILGAFFFVYFVVFVLRTRRGPFFAAVFVVTSFLEIVGTRLGDWTWAFHAPYLGVAVGNPPSVIAGAYCVLDALVVLSHRKLVRHNLLLSSCDEGGSRPGRADGLPEESRRLGRGAPESAEQSSQLPVVQTGPRSKP